MKYLYAIVAVIAAVLIASALFGDSPMINEPS